MDIKLGEPKPCPKCGHYNPPGRECTWCDGTHKLRIKGETMKLEKLKELLQVQNPFTFEGDCMDCNEAVTVKASQDGEETTIEGGAVFHPPSGWNYTTGDYMFKCEACFGKDPVFHPRTEIYSRVVGYYRPVNNWHQGKAAEWKQRKTFDINSLPTSEP